MDRGVWQTTVQRTAKSQTELSMHSLESNSRNNKYFGHNQEEEKIVSLTRRETDFALTVTLH